MNKPLPLDIPSNARRRSVSLLDSEWNAIYRLIGAMQVSDFARLADGYTEPLVRAYEVLEYEDKLRRLGDD